MVAFRSRNGTSIAQGVQTAPKMRRPLAAFVTDPHAAPVAAWCARHSLVAVIVLLQVGKTSERHCPELRAEVSPGTGNSWLHCRECCRECLDFSPVGRVSHFKIQQWPGFAPFGSEAPRWNTQAELDWQDAWGRLSCRHVRALKISPDDRKGVQVVNRVRASVCRPQFSVSVGRCRRAVSASAHIIIDIGLAMNFAIASRNRAPRTPSITL